jgi:hypothetical protein
MDIATRTGCVPSLHDVCDASITQYLYARSICASKISMRLSDWQVKNARTIRISLRSRGKVLHEPITPPPERPQGSP